MKLPNWRYLLAGLIGVAFDVIFFWRLPYSQRESPQHPAALPLYALPVLAFVLGLFVTLGAQKRQMVPLSMLAGFSAANVVLIIADCWHDPTNHNLWPFEFLIILVLTAPAFLGAALARFWPKRT